MAANPNILPNGPLNWLESWRASLFRFTVYRTFADQPGPIDANDYDVNRDIWMALRPWRMHRDIFAVERIAQAPWRLIARLPRNPNLDGPLLPNAADAYYDARDRLHQVQHYFGNEPMWQYRKSLGYRQNRLELLYRHQAWPPMDFVVKVEVDLESMESGPIRREAEILNNMEKSAHIVQQVKHTRVGLPYVEPFEYELVPSDDSSEPEDSSGSESREDEPDPAQRDNRTRRQIQAQDPARARQKANAHARRIRAGRRARLRRIDQILRLRARDEELYRQGRGVLDRANIHQENRADYLLLERGPHCDLETLMLRVMEEQMMFPNTVLWSFFLCLVRACVAMEYPIRKFDPRRRDEPLPGPGMLGLAAVPQQPHNRGNFLYEEAPDVRKQWAGKRLVHFDIELSNIFVTYTDPHARNNEHRIVPGLKLGNFSSAQEVKPKKRNAYYTKLRDRGSWGNFAPEQFGQDWNFVAKPDGTEIDHDGPEISEEGVAGNYGAKTNIWGIGLIMWQLITQMRPPVPPQPQRGTIIGPNFPDNYAYHILTHRRYEAYDIELRIILAACLAADPAQRPDPARLLEAVKVGVEKRFPDESDAIVGDWVAQFIYNAR